jgi:hypothetical protein
LCDCASQELEALPESLTNAIIRYTVVFGPKACRPFQLPKHVSINDVGLKLAWSETRIAEWLLKHLPRSLHSAVVLACVHHDPQGLELRLHLMDLSDEGLAAVAQCLPLDPKKKKPTITSICFPRSVITYNSCDHHIPSSTVDVRLLLVHLQSLRKFVLHACWPLLCRTGAAHPSHQQLDMLQRPFLYLEHLEVQSAGTHTICSFLGVRMPRLLLLNIDGGRMLKAPFQCYLAHLTNLRVLSMGDVKLESAERDRFVTLLPSLQLIRYLNISRWALNERTAGSIAVALTQLPSLEHLVAIGATQRIIGLGPAASFTAFAAHFTGLRALRELDLSKVLVNWTQIGTSPWLRALTTLTELHLTDFQSKSNDMQPRDNGVLLRHQLAQAVSLQTLSLAGLQCGLEVAIAAVVQLTTLTFLDLSNLSSRRVARAQGLQPRRWTELARLTELRALRMTDVNLMKHSVPREEVERVLSSLPKLLDLSLHLGGQPEANVTWMRGCLVGAPTTLEKLTLSGLLLGCPRYVWDRRPLLTWLGQVLVRIDVPRLVALQWLLVDYALPDVTAPELGLLPTVRVAERGQVVRLTSFNSSRQIMPWEEHPEDMDLLFRRYAVDV